LSASSQHGGRPAHEVRWCMDSHGSASARQFATVTDEPAGGESLRAFRRKASSELEAIVESQSKDIPVSPAQVAASFQSIAQEVASCPSAEGKSDADSIQTETQAVVEVLDDLLRNRAERAKLSNQRSDLLAVGYQNMVGENKEFGALILCAIAGIFAVSLHPIFFSIFGIAYWLYRRSTAQVRKQRAAVEELEGILEQIKELEEKEAQQITGLSIKAKAWSCGDPVSATE